MFDLTDPALSFALSTFVGIAVLTVIVMRRSIFPGKRYLVLASLGTLWWLFVTAMELNAEGLAPKVFWSRLSWVSSTTVSMTWAMFLHDYCFGRQPRSHWPRYAVILVTLGVVVGGSQTDAWHGLFYGPGTVLITDALRPFVVYDHGPLIFAFAAVLYVWFAGSVAIAVFAALRATRLYRPLFRILLAVALIPVSGNLGYLLFDITMFDFDPTPFLFAVSLILVSWLLFIGRFLELDTVAKESVFVSTADAIVTYDRLGHMAGSNEAARALFGNALPQIGKVIPRSGHIWGYATRHLDAAAPPAPGSAQIEGRHYDLRLIPIERPLHRGDAVMGWVLTLRDTTDLLQATAELRAESDRMSTLMEHSAAGVFVTGPDNQVSYANAELAHILGMDLSDLIGINVTDPRLTLDVIGKDPRLPIRQVRETGKAVRGVKLRVTRPDGTQCILTVTAAPLDQSGRVVCSVYDITEQEKAADALRDAAARAQAASDAKSQFLANMSHEIRTPLNGVLGMAEVLSYTDLTTEQARILGTLTNSGELLLGILNDVLDMAKIESGALSLSIAPMRPLALGQQVQALFADQAAAKGLKFQVVVSGDPAARRMGDELRLLQILQNLTSNAIKFTSSGEISVHLSLHDRGPLIMTVRDTGIGMSKEEQARVFEAFQQADATITRQFGGTGLGLSILRSLVDLMGGEVSLDSHPGEGTDVRVTLPLEPA